MVVLAIYLAITTPLIQPGVRPGASALHIAVLMLVLLRLRAAKAGVLDQWMPLLAIPFLYGELPSLMHSQRYHDGVIRHWEAMVFGVSPAATLAGRYPDRLLSEILHIGYLSYYPIIYVPPLVLFLRGREEAFRIVAFRLMLVYAVCFLVFALFPVEGPRYEWHDPPGIAQGPVRQFTVALLNAGSSRGAAFPSSHVAVAVVQAVMSIRVLPTLAVPLCVATILLSIGAVYGGFHYGCDVLTGAALGLAIGLIGWRQLRQRPAVRG